MTSSDPPQLSTSMPGLERVYELHTGARIITMDELQPRGMYVVGDKGKYVKARYAAAPDASGITIKCVHSPPCSDFS